MWVRLERYTVNGTNINQLHSGHSSKSDEQKLRVLDLLYEQGFQKLCWILAN